MKTKKILSATMLCVLLSVSVPSMAAEKTFWQKVDYYMQLWGAAFRGAL